MFVAVAASTSATAPTALAPITTATTAPTALAPAASTTASAPPAVSSSLPHALGAEAKQLLLLAGCEVISYGKQVVRHTSLQRIVLGNAVFDLLSDSLIRDILVFQQRSQGGTSIRKLSLQGLALPGKEWVEALDFLCGFLVKVKPPG